MDIIKTFLDENDTTLPQLMHTLDIYFSETDYNIVTSIVAYGMYDEKLHTIYKAAQDNNLSLIMHMDKIYPVRFREAYNEVLLRTAIQFHNLTIIKYLASIDADLTSARSWLYLCISKGNYDIVMYLIYNRILVEGLDYIIVHMACDDNMHLVKCIINMYAYRYNIVEFDEYGVYSPLDIVKYLISSGVDIHVRDYDLLKYMAGDGHLEAVKFIVERYNFSDSQRYAYIYAASRGQLEVVKYFVEECNVYVHANSDLAFKNAVYGDHLDVVKYLITFIVDHHTIKQSLEIARAYRFTDIANYIAKYRIKKIYRYLWAYLRRPRYY